MHNITVIVTTNNNVPKTIGKTIVSIGTGLPGIAVAKTIFIFKLIAKYFLFLLTCCWYYLRLQYLTLCEYHY
jgi:hypothetical protein